MPIKYRTYKFFPYPLAFDWDNPFNTFRAPTPNFRIVSGNQVIRGGELGATIANQLGSFGRIVNKQMECTPGSGTPGQQYGETAIAVQSRLKTATKYFKSLTASGFYDIAWGSIGGALPVSPVDGQTIRLTNLDNDEVRLYAYANGAWRYAQETIIAPIRPALTILAVANGSSNPTPGVYSGLYDYTIFSAPDPGYGLVAWILDGASIFDYDPIDVTMLSAHTLAPSYDNNYKTLVINSPAGTGVASPGQPSPPPNTYYVYTGLTRHLLALYTDPFLQWVEGGIQLSAFNAVDVTMDVDHNITPWYVDWYNRFIRMSSAGAGTGATSPATGDTYYTYGDLVNLLATPDPGSTFTRWEIDGIYYYDNPHAINVYWGTTVVAVFS